MRPHAFAFAIAAGLVACNDDKPAPKAPAQAANPQVAAPASQPASSPHGAVAQTPPGAPFSGLVKLGEGLSEADVKPTDVLFIMARESQGGGLAGRLVAVQRMGKIAFPLRYEIGSKDVMVPGIPFSGPFIVHARLDRDGDPMTRGEDDLYGNFPEPAKPGQEGVHIVLAKGKPKPMKAPPGVRAPGSPGGAASQPAGHPASQPSSQPAAR